MSKKSKPNPKVNPQTPIETWARAANLTSRHKHDYFIEALRDRQREDRQHEKDIQREKDMASASRIKLQPPPIKQK